jgi:hypothetical protein
MERMRGFVFFHPGFLLTLAAQTRKKKRHVSFFFQQDKWPPFSAFAEPCQPKPKKKNIYSILKKKGGFSQLARVQGKRRSHKNTE